MGEEEQSVNAHSSPSEETASPVKNPDQHHVDKWFEKAIAMLNDPNTSFPKVW